MTKDEALKLALDALDCIYSPLHVREIEKVGNAMKVIKEALAQPEQEPVAVDCCANCLRQKHEHMGGYCPNPYTTVWHAWDYPFTPDATPPQRKPEQKPVAFRNKQTGEFCTGGFLRGQLGQWTPLYEEHTIPLYITPPQRKPLADEQLIAAYESEQQGRYGDHIRSLRAIEAAHGIKGE